MASLKTGEMIFCLNKPYPYILLQDIASIAQLKMETLGSFILQYNAVLGVD